MADEETTLEYTPTWVVAAVCTVIVAISLAAERLLHYAGKYLKKKNQKPLYEALQKVKEELMLLGFISLLLTVFQSRIVKICVHEDVVRHLLPCSLEASSEGESSAAKPETTSHLRRLLAETGEGYCEGKLSYEVIMPGHLHIYLKLHQVPLLSLEALHHLHIFIFVLAIVHVTFSVLTVVFGGAKIRQWKHWEDSIAKENFDASQVLKPKVTHVHQHDFIKDRFRGIGKRSAILGWLHSFFKQFYGSVTKTDYVALRLGFITTHCRGNPKFNFHKYMIRALEDDFKKVVGIRQLVFVDICGHFLAAECQWVAYVLLDSFHSIHFRGAAKGSVYSLLLLAVGSKLEHIISQLAHEVAEKHIAIEGELVVKPSDDHFWFHRPRIVLFLIHFILFQNAFEIAFFFWILVQYGFDSCIMGQVRFIVPRLIIGIKILNAVIAIKSPCRVFIQVLCSYSTLPLYAIVTQMGTNFKKSIFDEHIQVGLVGWAQKVKRKKGLKAAATGSVQGSSTDGSTAGIQLGRVVHKESAPES
ncbi:hypothetical protein RJ639_028241 [Escallonia herrerae]|uniref:MLO-like protein n=1 Tax=Escallonia herrerae TaxID=1293975 RepID=A0AA88XAI7_9ASTE|nr:hypothetical protein RJ639_028241 [Escallonia herrerae]